MDPETNVFPLEYVAYNLGLNVIKKMDAYKLVVKNVIGSRVLAGSTGTQIKFQTVPIRSTGTVRIGSQLVYK